MLSLAVSSAWADAFCSAAFFTSCPEGSAPTIMGKSGLNVSTTEFTLGGDLQVTPANASAVPAGTTVYCGFASCVPLSPRLVNAVRTFPR